MLTFTSYFCTVVFVYEVIEIKFVHSIPTYMKAVRALKAMFAQYDYRCKMNSELLELIFIFILDDNNLREVKYNVVYFHVPSPYD